MKKLLTATSIAMLALSFGALASPAQAAGVARTTTLTCPSGTVPGWLDMQGNPTSCVGDTAGNNPPPSTLTHFVYHPVVTTYKVKRGDTLWRIAVNQYGHGTNQHAGQQYRRIMTLNHLHSTRLHVGQILRIS